MSKADRIPDAWPAQMSDVIAARYCDYSVSQFQAMVKDGRIEAGKVIPGSRIVRWHRVALDRHLADIHGVDTLPGAPPKSAAETRAARREAYEQERQRRKHRHEAA